MACDYLKKKGYRILGKNYVKIWDDKTKGEIDIIARKKGIISFVEVKAQSGSGSGFFPEDKVNFKKKKKLIKLAQKWLSENNVPLESPWQIDVIGILVSQELKESTIQHFENAVEG